MTTTSAHAHEPRLGTVRRDAPAAVQRPVAAASAMTVEQQEQARAGMLGLLQEYRDGARQAYEVADTVSGREGPRERIAVYDDLTARVRSTPDLDALLNGGALLDRHIVEDLREIRSAAVGDTAVDREQLSARAQREVDDVPWVVDAGPPSSVEQVGIDVAGDAGVEDESPARC